MYRKYIKRTFDFFCAAIMLLILAPILLLIMLLIVIDSKGPVFFLQERIGKNGKVFNIIKFRTMIVGAESVGMGIRTSSSDPRITKVGAVLRKTSLDELPQLINIIKGEMSFVGPRPPVTYHPYNGYDSYPDWSKPRFEVLPGITGYAQEEVRNFAPWDERMKYDVKYVENITFLGDIKIIFKTAVNILKLKSVYREQPAASGEQAKTAAENKDEVNV